MTVVDVTLLLYADLGLAPPETGSGSVLLESTRLFVVRYLVFDDIL